MSFRDQKKLLQALSLVRQVMHAPCPTSPVRFGQDCRPAPRPRCCHLLKESPNCGQGWKAQEGHGEQSQPGHTCVHAAEPPGLATEQAMREEERHFLQPLHTDGALEQSVMFTLQDGKFSTWFPRSTTCVTTSAPLSWWTAQSGGAPPLLIDLSGCPAQGPVGPYWSWPWCHTVTNRPTRATASLCSLSSTSPHQERCKGLGARLGSGADQPTQDCVRATTSRKPT